jgi:hypothetical protein
VPKHYFLPKSRIAFTIIPKTGCTTLLNYLIGIEEALGSELAANKAVNYPELAIHESTTDSKYLVKELVSGEAEAETRVLILRNPYLRALSVWANKLLYAQSDFAIFQRLRSESFTPVDFHTLADLNDSFEGFLTRLLQDKAFLDSDRHWRPQSTFFNSLAEYNIVIETASLSSLQEKLASRTDLAKFVEQRPVPKFNSTNRSVLSLIGTEKSWSLIEKVYEQDFQFLKQAGFDPIEFPNVTVLTASETEMIIRNEKPAIFNSRLESELGMLRNQISSFQTSRSWRWTAWLRTIGGLLENKSER